jgi:hypothetical protein
VKASLPADGSANFPLFGGRKIGAALVSVDVTLI